MAVEEKGTLMKHPITTPTSMVATTPPGSSPGSSHLATAPASTPRISNETIPMTTPSFRRRHPRSRLPGPATRLGCTKFRDGCLPSPGNLEAAQERVVGGVPHAAVGVLAAITTRPPPRTRQVASKSVWLNAEWYVLEVLGKSRDGLCEHTRQGWNIGRPPYGYLAERVPHPVPAKRSQGATKSRL